MSLDLSVDWSRFEWKSSVEDPAYYRRETGGAEYAVVVGHRFFGKAIIFRGGNITLCSPLPLTVFAERLQNAWIALRYTTPIIALCTEWDELDKPFMTYRAEPDVTKVKEWAARTVRIAEGVHDLDELRLTLSHKSLPDELGDQTMLYVCPITDTQYGLVIHTSHTPFDGFGIEIVLNRLLMFLGAYIGGAPLDDMNWGSEGVNLTPALSSVTTEPREGPEYTRTLTTILQTLSTSMTVSRNPSIVI